MRSKTLFVTLAAFAVLGAVGAAGPTASAASASAYTATSKVAQQSSSTAESAAPALTFWAKAEAVNPFTLTPKSTKIYAQGKFTGTGGSPSACALGVDLELFDPQLKQWVTAAHQPMKWGKCSGVVNTP